MINLIIFDLDGVLAETEHIHFGTLCDSINFVTGLSKSAIINIIKIDGSTTKNKLAILRDIYNWDDRTVHEIDIIKQERVLCEFANIRSKSEQIDMLSILSKEYKLAIGSNARKPSVDMIVDAMQIRHFFHHVIAIDDIGIPKPDPAIYNHIMRLMNTNPADTLIIEDSPRGIQAAIASYANVLIAPSVKETTLGFIQNAIKQYNTHNNSPHGGNRLEIY